MYLWNQTFTLSDEEVAYIWDCFPGDHPYSVEHELTFFVLDEQSGKYDRFDELHKQRTYPVKEYESWLNRPDSTSLQSQLTLLKRHLWMHRSVSFLHVKKIKRRLGFFFPAAINFFLK